MKMFIYKVERDESGGYDTYDSFVCNAQNESCALLQHPAKNVHHNGSMLGEWEHINPETKVKTPYTGGTWVSSNNLSSLTYTLLGVSTSTTEGVILASFNAG